MGNKRIILFFITGIFLCLFILIVGRNSSQVLVRPDKDASLLVKGSPDDITKVVIERAGQRIEICRDGSRWRMLAPIDAGVDQGVMTRLLNGFDSVVVKDRLGAEEIKGRGLSIADYGLYPARARVTLQKSEKESSFLFGISTASGTDVYVRKNQQNQILVVSHAVYDVIPDDANMLRSRRLVDCDPVVVNSIDIRRPGHPFIRLVMQNGIWIMEEPVSSKASLEKVEGFLNRLFDVRVFKFVWPSLENVMDVADYERALKMRKGLYGLDDDVGTSIHIHTMDGSCDSNVLVGHKKEKAGESVYALLDNGRAIGMISNSFESVVSVESGYFRSMRMFEELTHPIERIQFMVDKELFALSRTNDLWKIDAPASEPADQAMVQRSVDNLLSLRADRIENRIEQDDSGAQGEDLNYVKFSAGAITAMISVKKTDYEGLSYELSFADQPEVYYVAGSNMPPVLVNREVLLDFRDKTLLSLPDGTINRITIKKFGTPAFGIDYRAEDQSWHPSTGNLNRGRFNLEAFNKFLTFLNGLQANKVVKVGLAADDPGLYGFVQPWLEINLDVNVEDAVRRTLLIGRSAGGGMRYVMVRGGQSVFLVEEKRLSVFAEALIVDGG